MRADRLVDREFLKRIDEALFGVPDDLVDRLQQSVADTLDLMVQFKVAHWNVKGSNFYSLHLLFDDIHKMLGEQLDDLGERITALGGTVNGTVRAAALASRIPEYQVGQGSGLDHLIALVDRLNIQVNNVREDLKAVEGQDLDTQDLYLGISRDLEKKLWFLRSHLENRETI